MEENALRARQWGYAIKKNHGPVVSEVPIVPSDLNGLNTAVGAISPMKGH
jgi:hypothetical protein